MSSDSASKPDKFSVGSCVSYFIPGHCDTSELTGRGRILYRSPAPVRSPCGEATWTLTIAPLEGGDITRLHESWCKPIPDPRAVPDDFPPQDLIEVEDQVIAEIRQRRDAGRKKYGTSMERDDLSVTDWIQHAKEEALDFAIYLEKLKREVSDDGLLAQCNEALGFHPDSQTDVAAELRRLRQENRDLFHQISSRDDASVSLDGSETLTTFGGEGAERDGTWDEYGLDLGQVSVHGVTPAQAIQLACTLVDHLVRNGHDFELREGTHQDQRLALVCTR